ncbi:MAG: CHAT domain-containing tetratricopeptide repeat protein [Bacteroidota bacterium]
MSPLLLSGQSGYDSAEFYHDKATPFERAHEYDSAIFYHKKAADLYYEADSIRKFLNETLWLGYCELQMDRYAKAESILEPVLIEYGAELKEYDIEAYFLSKLSLAAARQKKVFEAYTYSKQAYNKLKPNQPSWLVNDVIGMLASTTRYLGFYDESLKYCNELIELASDSLTKSHTYNTIGLIHKRLKNSDIAFSYYSKCLKLRRKYGPDWAPYVMNNISDLHTINNDLDSALYWVDHALDISYKRFGREWQLNYMLLLNKSNILFKLDSAEASKSHLRESYDILRSINSKRDNTISYWPIIQTALFNNADQLAKEIFDESVGSIDNMPTITQAEYLITYGRYQQKTGNPDSALYYLDKCIDLFTEDSVSSKIPNSREELLHIRVANELKLKALYDLYEHNNDESYLVQIAANTDQLLSQVTNQNYEHFSLASSSNFFADENRSLNGLLEASARLYEKYQSSNYLNNVSKIIESKRLNSFKREFAFAYLQTVNGISDSLLLHRRNLQARIFELSASKESNQKEEFLSLKRDLERIHLEIKSSNENFYTTIKSDIKSLKEIEERLTDETLLQFSFSDEHLYILTSNNNGSNLNIVDWTKEKQDNLIELITGLKTNQGQNTADVTHKFLTDIDWQDLDIQTTRVRIIGDRQITLIPFEALIYQEQPLVQRHEFIYTNSLVEFKRPEIISRELEMIAFAPFADKVNDRIAVVRANAGSLPSSKVEVEAVNKTLNGLIYLNKAASENQFKHLASRSNIMHLATHSIVDNSNPMNSYIMFATDDDGTEDGLLHTYELLGMQLNADLVTLSACNTGVGKYFEGEGMVSLATGFNIAGVDNVVMSLWPVPDYTTAEIMESFYYHMNEGMEISGALRQAKLDFLQNNDSNLHHPYYWAGFVINSDKWSDGSDHWVLIFSALLAVGALGIIIRKTLFNRK